MNEKEILIRAVQRDPDAFISLIQSHMQRMYKTAILLLRREEDAADAIQDTILAAWENVNTLKNPQYFSAWVMKILTNKCYDILRKRDSYVELDAHLEHGSPDPAFNTVEWQDLLFRLSENYRIVLLLYYAEGFKTSEIAQILEIPEATVRTRLKRARRETAKLYGGRL